MTFTSLAQVDFAKKVLRKQMLERRNEIFSAAEPFATIEQKLCQNLSQFLLKLSPRLCAPIASFIPFGSEFDLNGTFKGSRWFPKTAQDRRLLWFSANNDEIAELPRNHLGLAETKTVKSVPCSATSQNPWIVIVPALCADLQGNRLGYGGGYYDRFIFENRNSIVTVVCVPKRFVLHSLPNETHDQSVNYIVTEDSFTKIHSTQNQQL